MAVRKTTSTGRGPKRSSPGRKRVSPAAKETSSPQLVFHEVDEARWPDFARLFESRGGPSYCWCMAWRANREEVKHTDRSSRRTFMQQRVREGVPMGILGYLDGEPVAWCSIAPRETYRPSLGGVDAPGDAPGTVWSLACLFISRPVRGQGVTRQLIEAAIAHARARGARSIEAYPVDPDSPSYRFMGFVGTFDSMGFQRVGSEGPRRYVVRYDIS